MSHGPIGVLATLSVPQEQAPRLAAALADLAEAARCEPGTWLFAVHADRDHPGVFRVFERYADEDAATAHRTSPAMARFRAALTDLGVRPDLAWLNPLDDIATPPPASEPAAPRRVLVVTGGHRVAMEEFLACIEAICTQRGWVWAHVTHPGAQRWLSPQHAGAFDVLLLHDLPGLSLRRGQEPAPVGPDPQVARAVSALLEAGQPVVALHHTLAGWPAWDGWAQALGGRFLYAPGQLLGQELASSGYRMSRHTVHAVDPTHPVVEGVGPLTLDDELYFAPVLQDVVRPLLRSDADFDGALFLDTFDVVSHGSSTGVTCAGRGVGSDLVGWETVAGRSPLVYLQPGDGPATFADEGFRRLLGNALAYVTSPAARAAAAAAPRPVEPPPGQP